MTEIKEVEDEKLREIDLLTETVGELAAALEGMNEALLVILYNLDLKIPDWKDRVLIVKNYFLIPLDVTITHIWTQKKWCK